MTAHTHTDAQLNTEDTEATDTRKQRFTFSYFSSEVKGLKGNTEEATYVQNKSRRASFCLTPNQLAET